jgi:hypothetical protein
MHHAIWPDEGTAPHILNLATTWRCVVSFTPREKNSPVHNAEEAGWATGPVWKGWKKKKSIRFSYHELNTDRPPRGTVLY